MRKSILLLGCIFVALVFSFASENSSFFPDDNGIKLHITGDTARVGEMICVEIVADGITDITELQFGLLFDYARIKLDTIESFLLPDSLHIETDVNNIIIKWKASDNEGITLPNGSILFQLCFQSLLISEGGQPLQFVNYPTPIRAFDSNDTLITIITSINDIRIIPLEDISLVMTDTVVSPGEQACTRVGVAAFEQLLVGLQFSIHWDTTALQFDNIYLGNVPNVQLNRDFNLFRTNEGFITFAWVDLTLQGLQITPGTTFFEICFIAKDTTTVSEIYFSDSPTMQAAYDDAGNAFNVYGQSGHIAISENPNMRPGDTNQDGIVNHFDLLNIGLGYGSFGPNRSYGYRSEEWTAQPAVDWDTNTPISQINYKHFDADGNGLIESMDAQAIENNWGSTIEDGIKTSLDIQPREDGAPLFLETYPLNASENASFEIMLGKETDSVSDVYGIAFSIIYDPDMIGIDQNTVNITFSDSWLGTLHEDLLVLQYNNPAERRIDVALVRTDGQNRSGYGSLGQLQFSTVAFAGENDDILLDSIAFRIENTRMINASEEALSVSPQATTVILTTTSIYNPLLASQIKLFPNPTSDQIFLQTDGLTILQVDCFDANGRLLRRLGNKNQIFVKDLMAGTYWLRIITDKGLTNRPFILR